jgi:hypothetical protein
MFRHGDIVVVQQLMVFVSLSSFFAKSETDLRYSFPAKLSHGCILTLVSRQAKKDSDSVALFSSFFISQLLWGLVNDNGVSGNEPTF